MKKLILLNVIIFLMVLFSVAMAASGVNFHFKNNTDQKVIVWLYWIDHDFNYFGPVNLACSEMKPRQEWKVEHDYKIGEYIIVWKTMDSKIIKITHSHQISGLVISELIKEDLL